MCVFVFEHIHTYTVNVRVCERDNSREDGEGKAETDKAECSRGIDA